MEMPAVVAPTFYFCASRCTDVTHWLGVFIGLLLFGPRSGYCLSHGVFLPSGCSCPSVFLRMWCWFAHQNFVNKFILSGVQLSSDFSMEQCGVFFGSSGFVAFKAWVYVSFSVLCLIYMSKI